MTARMERPTAEEWQARRPDHINASEMGTLIGVSKYGSIVDLWGKKVNRKTESLETEATLWGHIFEDGVAKMFETKTGLEVIDSSRGDWQFIREEEPWMACSPDRTFWKRDAKKNAKDWSQKGLLECKTTTSDPEAEGNEWMLKSWYAQVQWQLLVAEMDDAYLCCCVFGHERKTIIRHWPANVEFQERLYDIAKEFWETNVKGGKQPEPRTAEDVMKLWPESVADKVVEADDDTNGAWIELRAVKANIKALETREKELTDKIAVAMGDAERLEKDGQLLATYKSQTSNRFDTTRFKSTNPDLYETYLKQSTTRVMRMK